MSRLHVGIDVGSTTVKAVVVDPESREIIWKDYQRHETRQPEMVLDFLIRIGAAVPTTGSDTTDLMPAGRCANAPGG